MPGGAILIVVGANAISAAFRTAAAAASARASPSKHSSTTISRATILLAMKAYFWFGGVLNDAQHFFRSATREELSTDRASTPEKVTLNVALLPRANGVSTLRATQTNSSIKYLAPSTVGCSRM